MTALDRAHRQVSPPSILGLRLKLAYFFLSEASVSGGMPTTVTVPCSTLSGAAITRGSSLQRRFFVCGGKAYPQTWPCRGLAHTSLPRCPDNARPCSPRVSRGLFPGDTHIPDILSLSIPVCTVLWAFVSQSSCHHLCALPPAFHSASFPIGPPTT